MASNTLLETLLYRHKQAFQHWKAALRGGSILLGPEEQEAAWELFVLCADNLSKPTRENDEEILRVASDLADMVLRDHDIQTLNAYFRDALLDAVMRQSPSVAELTSGMVHFANLLSDAYRQAYADRLRRTIIHQRALRLEEELKLAKHIQERLLPKEIPHVPGYQFAGRVKPAAEVGGDYWSVKYYADDGIVTMKLADISGHGIAAATLVAAVKFISGGYYRAAETAHEVIERTNRVLVNETPSDVLVTMVYGWLHPDSNRVDIVNAGHEPVFLCSKDKCTTLEPTGPVLGVAQTSYGEHHLTMQPGDILFFCSDGIVEAGIGEPFGEARVKHLIVENRERSANEIADAVIEAVTSFTENPHDDMSLVVVKAVAAETG